ncbi:MAG: hypothetical protein ACI31W_03570, partial [Lactococcus sp.]
LSFIRKELKLNDKGINHLSFIRKELKLNDKGINHLPFICNELKLNNKGIGFCDNAKWQLQIYFLARTQTLRLRLTNLFV